MKKFINATIYGDSASHEILIENNRFKAIGNNLEYADEVIDVNKLLHWIYALLKSKSTFQEIA